MSLFREVKCPYGEYYAVGKINDQGELYTFMRDAIAKKDRYGKVKTGMPTLEAIIRREEAKPKNWKLVCDWYYTTRERMHSDFSSSQATHNDGTAIVDAPISTDSEPYSALKALLGNNNNPALTALLQQALQQQAPAPAPTPAPAPAPVQMPEPEPVEEVEVTGNALAAVIAAWSDTLIKAQKAKKSVPVKWALGNGRKINAYLRQIQGPSVYLTTTHTAKVRSSDGTLTDSVIKAHISEIEAR